MGRDIIPLQICTELSPINTFSYEYRNLMDRNGALAFHRPDHNALYKIFLQERIDA
jgi:hypothetical protein